MDSWGLYLNNNLPNRHIHCTFCDRGKWFSRPKVVCLEVTFSLLMHICVMWLWCVQQHQFDDNEEVFFLLIIPAIVVCTDHFMMDCYESSVKFSSPRQALCCGSFNNSYAHAKLLLFPSVWFWISDSMLRHVYRKKCHSVSSISIPTESWRITFTCSIFQSKHKHMFTFYVTPPHWYDIGA